MDVNTTAPSTANVPADISARWLWVAVAAMAVSMVALAGAWLMLPEPSMDTGVSRAGARSAAGAVAGMAEQKIAPVAQGIQAPQLMESQGYPAVHGRAAVAPNCSGCGVVESVQSVGSSSAALSGLGGLGMVAGGAPDGWAGRAFEPGERSGAALSQYRVQVRMHDGSLRSFTRSMPVEQGTPVRLQGRGFQVISDAAMSAATVASGKAYAYGVAGRY